MSQLVLSVAILWPVRHEINRELNDARQFEFGRITETRAPSINEGLAIVIPERLTQQEKLELKAFETLKWIPSVLNLPSGLVQLPYVILSPSKEEWVPVGLDLMTWRAITWPLIGILFWWSAGRGIDALWLARHGLVQPKVSWTETYIGIAFFLFCAMAAICLPVCGHNDHDSDFPLKLFSFGFAMWALLAAVVVIAKFRQRHISKIGLISKHQ